jgi:hypothetical protein
VRRVIWLLALPLTAQIQVTLSPTSKVATERILSRGVAKSAMPWLVSLRNDTLEAVSIQESAILGRIPQLQPFDHEGMALLVEEAEVNSFWQRSGRVGEDTAKLAMFLAATKTIKVSDQWQAGIAGVIALSPYIVQRLRGAARPVRANFERLAWITPINLQPGGSATARIFTAAWPNPQPVSFVIDTVQIQPSKVVQ